MIENNICRTPNCGRVGMYKNKRKDGSWTFKKICWKCYGYEGKLKKEIIDIYGGQCVCCEEKEITFLTIDHKYGGGNKERKLLSYGRGGTHFYSYLKKKGYPKENFQVLCMNCNWGSRYRICPHKII